MAVVTEYAFKPKNKIFYNEMLAYSFPFFSIEDLICSLLAGRSENKKHLSENWHYLKLNFSLEWTDSCCIFKI